MTARLLVGDVHERLREIDDDSVDFCLTSPPFLALRSYLPDGHPDKAKEIGSEPTPAAYLDVLLQLTAEWGRVLAPHGSIAVELGDTYNDGSVNDALQKSLLCIPQLYQVALAYGINPLTGQSSPAGRWRVRTLKPWIRSNPPVGALGDKERPATSYVIVACRAADRWFDLDAVRTTSPYQDDPRHERPDRKLNGRAGDNDGLRNSAPNPGGAPPLDLWHHVDAIIDAELDERDKPGAPAVVDLFGVQIDSTEAKWTTRGTHVRRRLERAGILTTLEALDVSPRGYTGAHYAVWPKELVKLLITEMCPPFVCPRCGPLRSLERDPERQPSRADDSGRSPQGADAAVEATAVSALRGDGAVGKPCPSCGSVVRRGHVLDPFVGSGTTLAVATGMGRTATGIDIDERNADLARERVGMFLDIDYPTRTLVPGVETGDPDHD